MRTDDLSLLLNSLNDAQRQAVAASLGRQLVLAGAGSGKTRVLVHRIAWLIQVEQASPHSILSVTFTNKAAAEMRQRIEQLLGINPAGMWVGTFHGLAHRLLRAHWQEARLVQNFQILDSDDQQRLVKRVMRELGLDEQKWPARQAQWFINGQKDEGLRPQHIQAGGDLFLSTMRDVYTAYEQACERAGVIDFSELLLRALDLWRDHPGLLEHYQRRFSHVLVDEFQDTNLAQYALVRQLASLNRNVFCVGDQDQSVYSWRGADWRNIQRFEQDFPKSQTILLEQNYRSRQTILDAAMGVIDRAPNRRRKQLFSDRGAGEKIFFYEAPDDYAEASFVVDAIAQLVASRQFEPGECAVMYRTNAMSRLLEEAFLQARLPYRLVGAQRFYGRREVKDVISFLRLVHNPADEASLDRVINVPPRGIGDKTLTTLHLIARQNNTQPGFVLMDMARGAESQYWKSFAGRAAISLADFGGMLANWRTAAFSLNTPELFDRVLKDLNFKEYIDDQSEEGVDRWENVVELKRLAEEYSTRTLDEFLENVALVSDQDTIKEGNVPTLLTLHAAKGLEFGVVFLVGLDDGILPHSRSFDQPESMEEERRLFYVGITRAKDKLYLIRAIQRGGRGATEETYPSRFLDDIPADLLVGKTRTGHSIRGRVPETQWSLPSRPQPARMVETKYRAGTHVRHKAWGEGIVLNSRIQDDDEIVDVVFESVGIKRLSAALANLTIV